MEALQHAWRRARFLAIAFVVAALPEKVKQRGACSEYVSDAMQALSGLAELVTAVTLFTVGLIRYVAQFSQTAGWTYLAHQATLDEHDFVAVGTLGAVSYLVQPASLALLYCYGEGIVRAVEAAFWGRPLGLGVISLLWRGQRWLLERGRRARVAALLGPSRPDEIVVPENGSVAPLEIYSVEDKPWSEHQIVERGGHFYRLEDRRLVARGAHHSYRYTLRLHEEREVIRGAIVRLDDQ